MYDLVIVGCGPAGMTAAIYAKRAGLSILLIEGNVPGGQMVNTSMVENYPGIHGSGADIALAMFNQVNDLGIEMDFFNVEEIKKTDMFTVIGGGKLIEAKNVIIASGTKPRSLDAKGEKNFINKGISWCAICDGSFYKDKNVVVIGGGNSAFEEALYLSQICKNVTIVHRSSIRAFEDLQKRVKEKTNIQVLLNTMVLEFMGSDHLSSVLVSDNGIEKTIPAEGAFLYIGFDPCTSMVKNFSILDDKGFILVDEHMETSIKGLYAVGDVVRKNIKQIVTATSDGAVAALAVASSLK